MSGPYVLAKLVADDDASALSRDDCSTVVSRIAARFSAFGSP